MSLRHATSALALALIPACDGPLEGQSDASDAEVLGVGFHDAQALSVAPLSASALTPAPASDIDAQASSRPAPLVVHFERSSERQAPVAPPLASPAESARLELAQRSVATVLGQLTETAESAKSLLVGERRFFVDAGALVLAHGESYDAAWSGGPAVSTSAPDAEFFSATRPVDLAKLPLRHRLLLGQTVRVYSDSRETCVATVSGFTIEAALTHAPGFAWNDDGEPIDPEPLSYTADEVFADGLAMLKAELTPVFGDCSTGLWADTDSASRPRVYTKADADKRLTRKALSAWRKSALYRTIDARYSEQFSAEYPRPAGRWDEAEGSRPEVSVHTAGDDTLVVVSADSWQGCGGPGDRGLAVFRLVGDALHFVTGVAGDTAPDAWADVDHDGHPEAIYRGNQLTRMVRFKLSATDQSSLSDLYDLTDTLESIYIPDYTDHGCGC